MTDYGFTWIICENNEELYQTIYLYSTILIICIWHKHLYRSLYVCREFNLRNVCFIHIFIYLFFSLIYSFGSFAIMIKSLRLATDVFITAFSIARYWKSFPHPLFTQPKNFSCVSNRLRCIQTTQDFSYTVLEAMDSFCFAFWSIKSMLLRLWMYPTVQKF